MQLSPNFTLAELTKTFGGLPNNPNAEQIENLRALVVNVLQPIRDHFGQPIVVSSGFRSRQVNDNLAHASKTSQHMKGEAADFDVRGYPGSKSFEVADWILKSGLPFDQMIVYHPVSSHIHISYKRTGTNRRQALRKMPSGRYVTWRGL